MGARGRSPTNMVFRGFISTQRLLSVHFDLGFVSTLAGLTHKIKQDFYDIPDWSIDACFMKLIMHFFEKTECDF